jgi:large subunit ribosomal protein L24
MALKLRKNDTVVVMSGRDRGKKGKIIRLFPKTQKAIVEGINLRKKHMRPTQANPKGGVASIEGRIHLSKLMLLDPQSSKPTRVGYTVLADGTKKRMSKRSQEIIE